MDLLHRQKILWDSFEVLDDLVCALDGYGAAWVADALAPPLLERALALFDLAMRQHQHNVKLKCEWGFHENRPALRLLVRKILMDEVSADPGKREAAFALKRRLVEEINPSDNHGFRAAIVAGLVERGLVDQAIELAEKYPDDFADMQYTHALALYVAGRKREAEAIVRQAVKAHPRLVKMLLAESPRPPRPENEGWLTRGGDEEAWHYREGFLDIWKKTGALAWLAEATRKKR